MRSRGSVPSLLVVALVLSTGTALAETRIRTIDHRGWHGSVEIDNGEVRVVVVPAVGRVMHLSLAGGPNLLWENPDLAGRTLADGPLIEAGQPVWANFGGDRVWPTEESWFPRLNGAPRPPDPWIDGKPFEARLLADGVVLEGPVSPLCGARLVRTVRVPASGRRVSLIDRLEKRQPARRSEHEPVPLTVWSLSQIRPPEASLLSLAEKSVFPGRFFPFRWEDVPGNDPAAHFAVEGDVGVFLTDPKLPQKVGADAPRWVAAIVGDTVLGRLFRYHPGREYPDGGTSATVFTSPELTELETLSPLARLRVGEAVEHPVDWVLQRLPAEARTPQQRRREAARWLDSLEPPASARISAQTEARAIFDWFEYAGQDPVHEAPAGPGDYRNPILGGFYPDPSIVRVGEDYYLVNSTFSWFPGIPVFHSRDLVNWTQIGNAIDRPGMLSFDGLGMSRGVFAPTIEHHEGTFFIANTCVDCGGNFVIQAKDPAGPWSDPIWTPHVGGIDPSLFFDQGRVYILNNDAPAGPPRYDGHRAIWIRQVDPVSFQPVSEARVLVDGGVRPEQKPIWIEGPHLYRVGDHFYLFCAEGGTGDQHSQVVLRSRELMGPYQPYAGNPVLTQRHLDPARPHPVTSTGHADLVQTQNGDWWTVFLGTRPYQGDLYNTGRETFLMPVRWRDGWPVVTEGQQSVPMVHPRPVLPAGSPAPPLSGNFRVREEFDQATLSSSWLFIRTVRERWHELRGGALELRPRDQHIGRLQQPSFVGRRQQHARASVSAQVRFAPDSDGQQAGLAAFQNDEHYYFLGIARSEGRRLLEVRRRAGGREPAEGMVLASVPLDATGATPLRLRIDIDGALCHFLWASDTEDWRPLLRDADATVLSTQRAGGFVGTVLGMYAYAPSVSRPR